MGSSLHFILLFSGLWALVMCVTRQFHVVEVNKTWTDAQSYCKGIYTDLATTETQEEMDTVLALMKDLPAANYWIGLRQQIHQNKNIAWVWSDGSNYTYSDWGSGEPNNIGSDNCVHLYNSHSYKWNDAGCNYSCPFICYKKIPLILIKQEMTWRDALRYCRENHVDLVSVLTNETQEWVETVTKNVSTPNVWMGLRFACSQPFWFWVSGSTVCYQNWAPGDGTGVEDCSNGRRSGAVQSGSKQWVSLPDTQKLNVICTI
uniref:C-type lectin domain-containing protein n=1 Tax=Electrophorus electricus TaxID=8005 RepID=A0A4W4DMP2_ELEEL